MITSPYIRADGTVTTVPRSIHHAGTGVEEYGYLVLNTRDLTRIDQLVADELVSWWAGEYRFRLEGQAVLRDATLRPVDHAALLRELMTVRVLPAAAAVSTDATVSELLHQASERSAPEDVPSIDVLIDPLAVATTIAHLVDGPIRSHAALEDAVSARSESGERPPRANGATQTPHPRATAPADR